ncbi:MAG: fibronectin type III domain-containing protein [Saprospiraceae bacterium]
MKHILFLSFLAVQSLAMANASSFFTNPTQVQGVVKPPTVSVSLISPGHHLVTWGTIAGSGNYSVGIVNLTTNQTHSIFSTPNNSATVSGLVPGNTYRFMIAKNDTIIIDIIDL